MKLQKAREVIKTNKITDVSLDVAFMSCVVDKADNLRVLESDTHFTDFIGVHPSKIEEGRLALLDILSSQDRENVIRAICNKESVYSYIDFYLKNKDGDYALIHCIGKSIPKTTRCLLTLADVSQSEKQNEMLKIRAETMRGLVDLIEGGVCLFRVTSDMHFESLYMNKACARFFANTMEGHPDEKRLDELIYPEDKSAVFQAIGNTMATKKPIDMELRMIKSKDSYIWCKLNSGIQRIDKDGCPIFHAVFTNITDIKEPPKTKRFKFF